MTATQIPQQQRLRLPQAIRQLHALLESSAIRPWKCRLFRPAFEQDWRALNARLLLDIGKSSADAEIASLWSRRGAATDASVDQWAKRALGRAISPGDADWG